MSSRSIHSRIRGENGIDYGIGGQGVRNVAAAGFANMHRLMEEYDYIALPQLVAEKAQFDMVFIDGYHSFDYTFLDFFYARFAAERRRPLRFPRYRLADRL